MCYVDDNTEEDGGLFSDRQAQQQQGTTGRRGCDCALTHHNK